MDLQRKAENRHTYKTQAIIRKLAKACRVEYENKISGLPDAFMTPDDSLEEVFLVPQVIVTVASVDKDHVCITGC